jgi:zinc protease
MKTLHLFMGWTIGRYSLAFLCVGIVVAAISVSAEKPVDSYKDLQYPPLNNLQIAQPNRIELSNGIILFLIEDHGLPMVNVSVLIRGGTRSEPVSKAGVADLCGTVMRTGGTASRPGDKLDEELDRLGAAVETGMSDDLGSASVSVLKEDTDKGLAILSDLLQNPSFPEDKIELAKIGIRDSIARRNDNPGGIVFREFERILFGTNSAYGHQPEFATVDAIKRDDLIAFYKQFYQPENLIVGVWGDFKASEMQAKIEATLGAWKKGGNPKPAIPAVESSVERSGTYYIGKEDINQTWVVVGHLGGQRNDPDYYALNLMNRILGGSMASRMFSNIRSDMGLAYNIRSSWNAEWDRPGEFIASGSTKAGTTVKMLNAMKHEIQRLTEEEVTEEELSRAKDGVLKGFAFEFDSTGKVVQRMMNYEFYGYPHDYLQRFRENIEKVSRTDILNAAKKHLHPDQSIQLLLGREKDFDQPLSTLGKVTPVDITIPGAPEADSPNK